MLRNCFLPVNYPDTSSKVCGEILYQNTDEFIITCTLCKIKIFEFNEFIGHLKIVHLDVLSKGIDSSCNSKNCAKGLEAAEECYVEARRILESDNKSIWEDGAKYKTEQHDNTEFFNYNDEEPVEEYIFSEDTATDDDEEEWKQDESIIIKTRKPKEYACAICQKKYADERRLKVHVKLAHLRQKPYKCSICNESFAEERSLQTHIGNKHTSYDCPTCHKQFSSSRSLKRHMQIHSEVKDFLCTAENCSKAFASKALLRGHQRCHRNENFICDECGYKCRTQDSLKVHKRHHTGEKPFACDQCDSRFVSKPLLKEHHATHEKERKHVCEVCGKSFNRPKALYHHKHLHLGIKKFVCKICGSAYAQAAGLSAHMRKHREEINGISSDIKMIAF